TPGLLPPAMRILYRPGTKAAPGTQPHSEAVARELCRSLGTSAAARLRPFFRVDRTSVSHDEIPRRFGWLLLANPAADLPGVTTCECVGAPSGEASTQVGEEPEASEFWETAPNDREESQQEAVSMSEQQPLEAGEALDSYEAAAQAQERWDSEALAGLDVEASGAAEAEGFEPEAWEAGSESISGEGPEGEELDSFEGFEATESPYAREGDALATKMAALGGLLENEVGADTGLADRVKGVAAFVLGPTLRRGSSGPAVPALHRALAGLGADVAVDGKFAASTESAVRAFQSRSGLTADGVVGPRTKAAIAALVGGVAPSPVPPAPTTPTPALPAPSGKRLTPAQFVATFGAAARASQAAHGVPALVTLGQAALESGWGQHAPRFNCFGIKAKVSDPESTRQLLRTREVFRDRNRKFPEVISITPRPDGKFDYVVRDWFRVYPDAAAAFHAHGEFLARNKRYAKAFTLAHDPYAFAAQVARAHYATDPSYERVLTNVMRTIEAAGFHE